MQRQTEFSVLHDAVEGQKRELQRQGYRLLLTGSNAHLLSSELATHLTGRHLPIVLLPFSFAESLNAFPTARTGPE